jgi:outer membrane immunogenic protein
MKKLAAVVAVAGLIGTPAFAADINARPPVPAPVYIYNWNGWYVGLNAGGAWTKTEVTDDALGSSLTLKASSFIGGVQAGSNWQSGPYLYGVETDADWTNAKGNSFITVPSVGGFTQSARETFFGTSRLRFGLVFDRTLIYVTGGLAAASVKSADSITGPPAITETTSNSNNFVVGGTVGGGIEYAFWTNWSVKAEYLYADLNRWDGTTPSGITFSHHLTENIARIGLNYQFH